MSEPIEFFFDFVSPYGYIASERIEAIAAKAGRKVVWRPILLGAVFKVSGGQPLTNLPPIKSDYSRHDFERSARQIGLAFRLPPGFPHATVGAARCFYWAEEKDPAKAADFIHRCYRAYFAQGRDISKSEIVADIAAEAGFSRDEALAGMNDQRIKDRLKAAVDDAIARGVFGSPFVVVGKEGFWGADRLEQVAEWLRRGGW
jgi:2-hydroxychromene-2-carboxylate isomerase